jgi:uncharacterized OB-fold protein
MKDSVEQGPDTTFARFLQSGVLHLPYCAKCSGFFFYPRVLCPTCASDDIQWREVSGDAVVYSTTTVRAARADEKDRNVAIVELKEGPRMMTQIEGIASGDVAIGMTVQARIQERAGTPVLTFFPGEKA